MDQNNERIDVYCSWCGSRDVYRDAYASWNIATQCWELSNVYDNGYCADCEGETRLAETGIGSTSDDRA